MGALDQLAGFAKEAKTELKLILDGAIEGIKKEAEAKGIELTDEQVTEILKEAGFWETVTKMRSLPGKNKLLTSDIISKSPKIRNLLAKNMHIPGVPYEGSLAAKTLIGTEKVLSGAGKTVTGVGKGVKKVTGLPKNLAHGIVEAPGVIKKTVETAVKKGPEQSESIKKLLAALGIGAGVGAGVAGADAARKKLWGDKSITPFGSSGEWGGVLGSKVEKKEEDQPKAAMVNPLMAGIPVATGIKSKDENWDLKKSLLAGIAAGILLKIPKFKPIGSAGLEKTIAGGLTGGVLGGIGHGISSLLRKKPEEEVELGKESALKIVYLSALENFQKIAKATDLNYTDEEVKRAIMKQAEQLEGSKRDITDAEAMAILQEAGKPKWFSGVFSKDPVAKIVGGKGDRNRKKLLEGIVNNYRSIWTGGLKRSAPKLDLAQMIREHANQSGGVG